MKLNFLTINKAHFPNPIITIHDQPIALVLAFLGIRKFFQIEMASELHLFMKTVPHKSRILTLAKDAFCGHGTLNLNLIISMLLS